MTINSTNNLGTTGPTGTNKNDNIDKSKVKNKEDKAVKESGKEIVDKFEKSEVQTEATYKKPVFTINPKNPFLLKYKGEGKLN